MTPADEHRVQAAVWRQYADTLDREALDHLVHGELGACLMDVGRALACDFCGLVHLFHAGLEER